MPDNSELTFKQLTQKLVILLLHLGGKHIDTIHMFNIDYMVFSESCCVFYPFGLEKHSRPGKSRTEISYRNYAPDPKLCIIECLSVYIGIRKTKVNSKLCQQLLITYGKPHKGASKDTIARWVKEILKNSGIDTSVFKPHSTRSASTSKALASGVPIDVILKHGNWSQISTFYRYFQKEIEEQQYEEDIDMGTEILKQFHTSQNSVPKAV